MAATRTSNPPTLPLVGRDTETTQLTAALTSTQRGQGGAWAITGPGGMGKTRLLQWVEQEAGRLGFQVAWGYCLKESFVPFFPFEQIFRPTGPAASTARPTSPQAPPLAELPAVLILEEEKPKALLERAAACSREAPTLLLTRDRPASLRARLPGLDEGAKVLWLTRAEGPEAVSPGAIDALAERLETFLSEAPGRVVALAGLEYMVSQSSFLPVLRLVQFLRDVAESHEGHLLLSVHPVAFESRELSLLEGEGDVIKVSAPASTEGGTAAPSGPEPPSMTLLRYVQILEKEAPRRPYVLLLDDFQWADPQSLLAFQFIARNTRRLPVLLVAGFREDDLKTSAPDGQTTLQEVLDNLGREGALQRLPLRGLAEGEAVRLVEALLGAPLSLKPGDAAFLALLERTEGNPYYLSETVRTLVDEGFARREGPRAVLVLPSPAGPEPAVANRPVLPPTIRNLVARRLSLIAAEDAGFLKLAAVAGSEFDLAPLEGVLGRPVNELEEIARRLEKRHRLLQPREKGPGWQFAHPLVWDVTLGEIPPAEFRAHALKLADWWAAHRPQEVEVVARLYHDADNREKGLGWVKQATDRALARQAGAAVERYVRWTQDLLKGAVVDPLQQLQETVRLAESLRLQGQPSDARRLLLDAVAEEPPIPGRWFVQRALVDVLSDVDPRLARTRLDDLVAETERRSDLVPAELVTDLLTTRAHLATLSGDWEQGLELAQKALDRLSSGGDAEHIARTLYSRGWCLRQTGRLDEAREVFARGRALAAEADLPALMASHMNGEAAVALLRGDLPNAVRDSEAALEQARRTGNIPRMALFLLNVAEARAALGELETARAAIEEALTLSKKFEVPRPAAMAAFRMGGVLLQEGKWEEARRYLIEAIAGYERLGLTENVAEARINLAQIRGETGDLTGALAELDEFLQKGGRQELRTRPMFHQVRGDLKGRLGDAPGAKKEFEMALTVAKDSQNLLAQAVSMEALAHWEEVHGDPAVAQDLRSRSQEIYRSCGVAAGPTPPSGR